MADDKDTPHPPNTPKPVHVGGDSLTERLLPHLKKIIAVFVGIAVVVTIVLVIRWRKHVGQEEHTTQLAQVLEVARGPVGPATPAIPGLTPPETGPRFETAQARATAVLDEMTKRDVEGPAAFRGRVLLDAGQVDQAISTYRAGQNAKGIDGVLAREGLGIALEAKAAQQTEPAARQGLLEESLAAFDAMQPDEAGPRREYMLYHQGRIQALIGKRTEAKALFEKARELGAGTELPELIEQRLAAMGS